MEQADSDTNELLVFVKSDAGNQVFFIDLVGHPKKVSAELFSRICPTAVVADQSQKQAKMARIKVVDDGMVQPWRQGGTMELSPLHLEDGTSGSRCEIVDLHFPSHSCLGKQSNTDGTKHVVQKKRTKTIIKNTTDLFPSTASAGLCSFKQSMSVGHPFGSAASVPRLQLLIDPHLIGSILGGSIYDPVTVSD